MSRTRNTVIGVSAAVLSLLLAACGGGGEKSAEAAQTAAGGDASGLSAFEMEHGIGPITEAIQFGPVDKGMAEAGQKVFETNCMACHKMAEKYVGPPLGDVTVRRSGAFIMNQILNPQGMYEKHPVAKQLLAEYMLQMPNQGLTQEQARQVLEYLRTQAPAQAGS